MDNNNLQKIKSNNLIQIEVPKKRDSYVKRKMIRSERFTKIQDSLILALNEVATSPYVAKRWIQLCLSYIEFVSPTEYSKEPGRLMRLLAKYPLGLNRDELLAAFYEGYNEASSQRRESLRVCLEKIIQRARTIFHKYDLTIIYCKINKKYLVSPVFITHRTNK